MSNAVGDGDEKVSSYTDDDLSHIFDDGPDDTSDSSPFSETESLDDSDGDSKSEKKSESSDKEKDGSSGKSKKSSRLKGLFKRDSKRSNVDDSGGEKSSKRAASINKMRESAALERVDKAYDNVTNPFLSIFTADGYGPPPDPDPDDIYFEINEDGEPVLDDVGEPIIVYVEPKMIRPWVCEYYYYPKQKARLAQHMLLAFIAFMICIAAMLNPFKLSALIAAILMLGFFINFTFRYFGVAVGNRPMPRIPILSNLRLPTDREARDYEEFVKTRDSSDFITPVKNYVGDTPSPATILTTWMNAEVEWSRFDLIEQSNGELDSFKVDLILSDSPEAWTNADILDSLSRLTGSNPQQWQQAYIDYTEALEELSLAREEE